MGGYQTEQPMLGKESVRPAMMVQAPTSAAVLRTLAKDASQSHAHSAVERPERGLPGMLEVFEAKGLNGVTYESRSGGWPAVCEIARTMFPRLQPN